MFCTGTICAPVKAATHNKSFERWSLGHCPAMKVRAPGPSSVAMRAASTKGAAGQSSLSVSLPNECMGMGQRQRQLAQLHQAGCCGSSSRQLVRGGDDRQWQSCPKEIPRMSGSPRDPVADDKSPGKAMWSYSLWVLPRIRGQGLADESPCSVPLLCCQYQDYQGRGTGNTKFRAAAFLSCGARKDTCLYVKQSVDAAFGFGPCWIVLSKNFSFTYSDPWEDPKKDPFKGSLGMTQ